MIENIFEGDLLSNNLTGKNEKKDTGLSFLGGAIFGSILCLVNSIINYPGDISSIKNVTYKGNNYIVISKDRGDTTVYRHYQDGFVKPLHGIISEMKELEKNSIEKRITLETHAHIIDSLKTILILDTLKDIAQRTKIESYLSSAYNKSQQTIDSLYRLKSFQVLHPKYLKMSDDYHSEIIKRAWNR